MVTHMVLTSRSRTELKRAFRLLEQKAIGYGSKINEDVDVSFDQGQARCMGTKKVKKSFRRNTRNGDAERITTKLK